LKSIATSSSVQDLELTYDEVGNVLTRFDDLIDKTETFSYDGLNRLATSQVTGQSAVSIAYSAAGRITSKSGVGSYTYGAGAAGPFAVTSANGLSYTYDANGRMITRGGDDITWYSYDLPKKIEKGTKTTEFWYGPDRGRYKQELRTSGGLDAVIRYVGTLFEFEDAATDVYRHYVHAGSRVVAMVERVGTVNTKHFLHRDHQGSVTKVTNAAGSVIQSLAFDAWGLRRDATNWSALGSPFAGTHEMERGYTGHEHLDTVGLIHMNGRVQDPVLGRFISADPFIQAPYFTQSHNRYSYVWNNPTSLVDPSGFETCYTAPAPAPGWENIDADPSWAILLGGPSVGEMLAECGYDPGSGADDTGQSDHSGGGGPPHYSPPLPPLPQHTAAGLRLDERLGLDHAQARSDAAGADYTATLARLRSSQRLDAGEAELYRLRAALEIKDPAVEGVGIFVTTVTGETAIVAILQMARAAVAYTAAARGTTTALSEVRYTQAGEKFIRYESANPAFSRVTSTGGVTPGTYAAPASDGLIPVGQRISTYNLPSPNIPRTNYVMLEPRAGTPVIGPRTVVGGTGNEVIFPFGF
jgi:RHS repeat-associated protein